MKLFVYFIEGCYLIVIDKCNIFECIEYLCGEENYVIMFGWKGLFKKYCFVFDVEILN